MQQAIDYTPNEGMEVTGWPVMTMRRGEVVTRDAAVQAEPGTGRFLPCGAYDFIALRGVPANGPTRPRRRAADAASGAVSRPRPRRGR